MKSKKLLFLIAISMVLNITNIFAQAGIPGPCGPVKSYHYLNSWEEPSNIPGQETQVSLNMESGKDLKVGIDPKAGATLAITVNGVAKYNGPTGDITITNPVPNVGDKTDVVVLYTDACGTFTYTWHLTGTGCIPLIETIVPYYKLNANAWSNGTSGNINATGGDSIQFGPWPTSSANAWTWTGNLAANLSSTTSREPTFSVTTSTVLTATIEYQDGCGNLITDSYNYNIIVDGIPPLAVNKFEQGGFSMYLNRTQNNLNIAFNEELNVSILNISGQKILSKNILKQGSIDISSLSSGVYFLKAVSNGESITRKFIKN